MMINRKFTFLQPPLKMDAGVQELQNQLLRGFVHKLNNQLAVIEGFCGLLRMNDNDVETAENLEHITEASKSAGSLGQKLMALGGCMNPSDQKLNLLEMIGSVSQEWKDVARSVGVSLTFQLPARVPLIRGDASRVMEILSELARNAWEAASEVQGSAEVEILAPSEGGASSDEVMVVFNNTGPGVPEERWQDFLKPFVSTKGAGHFGLGLSMSASLAHCMGMKLGVESSFSSTSVALRCPVV